QNPIGRRLTFDSDSDKDDFEIVGVIGDSKFDSAKEKPERTVFRPILQVQDQLTLQNVFELRTVGGRFNLSNQGRAAVTEVNDRLSILTLTSLRLQTDEALKQDK